MLQCTRFSDAEAQAIAYNDGMYVLEGRSVAHKEEPLLLFMHCLLIEKMQDGCLPGLDLEFLYYEMPVGKVKHE